MNIIVCVKLVPATNNVKLNNKTNTLIRENIESIINPLDHYAVEEALKIKDLTNGKVTILTMGITDSEKILKDIYALGVDEIILLSDKAFAGADTLATSYTLSMAIKKIGIYDIVICGKQSTDGDTGQIGPSLAEKLQIPHITCVKKIDNIDKKNILFYRIIEDGYEIIESTIPVLITVVKDINEPRLASLKGLMMSKKSKITIWNIKDINANDKLCGLNGSPTQVIKTFTTEHTHKSDFIEGSPHEQAKLLAKKIISINLNSMD